MLSLLLSMLLLMLLSMLLGVLLGVVLRLGRSLRRRLRDLHRRLHRGGVLLMRSRALLRRRGVLELGMLIPTRHVLLVRVLRTRGRC